jgi:hypothetical protein
MSLFLPRFRLLLPPSHHRDDPRRRQLWQCLLTASQIHLTATKYPCPLIIPRPEGSGLKNGNKVDRDGPHPAPRKLFIVWPTVSLLFAHFVHGIAELVELGLLELKERAYQVEDATHHHLSCADHSSQHILKSLTVENIPYEVFSPFSATFADVRKVQVNYFLEHWSEIRASEGMRNVWQQIRNGRHPGFEEGPYPMAAFMQVCLQGPSSVACHCTTPRIHPTS